MLSALQTGWAQERRFRGEFSGCLASDHDNEYMMIDATIVRAHQHSARPKKHGAQASAIPRRTDH